MTDWTQYLQGQGIDNPAGLPQWGQIIAELQAQANAITAGTALTGSSGSAGDVAGAGVWPLGSQAGLPPGIQEILNQFKLNSEIGLHTGVGGTPVIGTAPGPGQTVNFG